jgi:hypothetical protein
MNYSLHDFICESIYIQSNVIYKRHSFIYGALKHTQSVEYNIHDFIGVMWLVVIYKLDISNTFFIYRKYTQIVQHISVIVSQVSEHNTQSVGYNTHNHISVI